MQREVVKHPFFGLGLVAGQVQFVMCKKGRWKTGMVSVVSRRCCDRVLPNIPEGREAPLHLS